MPAGRRSGSDVEFRERRPGVECAVRVGGGCELEALAESDAECARRQQRQRDGERLGAPRELLIGERLGGAAAERPDAETCRLRTGETIVAILEPSASSSSDWARASSEPKQSKIAVTSPISRTRSTRPSP